MGEKLSHFLTHTDKYIGVLTRILKQFGDIELTDTQLDLINNGKDGAVIFNTLVQNRGSRKPHNSKEFFGFGRNHYQGKLKE